MAAGAKAQEYWSSGQAAKDQALARNEAVAAAAVEDRQRARTRPASPWGWISPPLDSAPRRRHR